MALFALILVMAGGAPARAQETVAAGLPDEGELRPWLGRYEAGPEEVAGPDQVHLNKLGDGVDATLWHELLQRYDGESWSRRSSARGATTGPGHGT